MDEPRMLPVRVYPVGNLWWGECIDYDIGLVGKTVAEVLSELPMLVGVEAVEGKRRTGSYLGGIPRPPDMPIEGTIQTLITWEPIEVDWSEP